MTTFPLLVRLLEDNERLREQLEARERDLYDLKRRMVAVAESWEVVTAPVAGARILMIANECWFDQTTSPELRAVASALTERPDLRKLTGVQACVLPDPQERILVLKNGEFPEPVKTKIVSAVRSTPLVIGPIEKL